MRYRYLLLAVVGAVCLSGQARQHEPESKAEQTAEVQYRDSTAYQLADVVVTGTRNAVDVRHLPMTVTVISRDALTAEHQTSLLPTVMQQVPSLFVTSRSMMGYGCSMAPTRWAA